MLYNKSLPFSMGRTIIWKTAWKSDLLGGTFVTCGFGWSPCTDVFRKVSREGYTAFTPNHCHFEATNYNNSSFISELACDNCTMTSLLFVLHVFCSIYCCLLSSWAQLPPLLHDWLCSNYPFIGHNYLAF